MIRICWWIVGRNTDAPYVAVDLIDENGLIGGTDSQPIVSMAEARLIVNRVAKQYETTRVIYDNDSTEFFAND